MYRRKANNVDANIYFKKLESFNEELEQEYHAFMIEVQKMENEISRLTEHIEKLANNYRVMKSKYLEFVYDMESIKVNPGLYTEDSLKVNSSLYTEDSLISMYYPIKRLLSEKEKFTEEVLKYKKQLEKNLVKGLENLERKKTRKVLPVGTKYTDVPIKGTQVQHTQALFNPKPIIESKPRPEPKQDNRNFFQKMFNL
jgi:DNA anti-recombination protein RmuC